MTITNHTPWRTDHLRAIVARVATTELDVEQRRRLRITFVKKIRRGWRRELGATSGRAVIGGSSMTIELASAVDRRRLAKTLAHEMAHIRGMRHAAMRGAPRYMLVAGWSEVYAWAESYPLERTAAPATPSVTERRSMKLESARVLLARWERRAKQAAGKIRRWRGRVRTLERAIAIGERRTGATRCRGIEVRVS